MVFQTRKSKFGFTLIELLVTISLIVVLISTLTLALNSARTSAQAAETVSRLSALKQATIRFKDDIGYLPPVLDTQRGLKTFPVFPPPMITPNEAATYRRQNQSWYSITSPSEFFIGYGNQAQDGYGRLPNSQIGDADFEEMPRLGIRHPSMDGVWRATDVFAFTGATGAGLLDERTPSLRGKLYGPYLEIENDQMLGRLKLDTNGEPLTDPITEQVKVFYPADPEYDRSEPMVIVDTWGSPIRYYRPVYPSPRDPNLPETGISRIFPQSNGYDRPTLSDFLVLRPYEFPPGKVIDGTLRDYKDGAEALTGDTSTTVELQTGQFAYFSSGPDLQSNDFVRADLYGLPGNIGEDATEETNADNLVEIGP